MFYVKVCIYSSSYIFQCNPKPNHLGPPNPPPRPPPAVPLPSSRNGDQCSNDRICIRTTNLLPLHRCMMWVLDNVPDYHHKSKGVTGMGCECSSNTPKTTSWPVSYYLDHPQIQEVGNNYNDDGQRKHTGEKVGDALVANHRWRCSGYFGRHPAVQRAKGLGIPSSR